MPDRVVSDLRTRIAAVLNANLPVMEYLRPGDTERAADAVIAELGAIPDRSFTDDQGRTWEWCGGEPGTWAWRITRICPESGQHRQMQIR